MKNRRVKQALLALACAFTVMSAGLPARAAEAVSPDNTQVSPRYTGSCGCVMQIEIMSLRSCTDNGNGTHTAVYNTTYKCSHGRVDRIETIKESHVFTVSYQDNGHVFVGKVDKNEHSYTRVDSCRCGNTKKGEPFSITCHGESNGGAHARP